MKQIDKILYHEIKPYIGHLLVILVLILCGVGLESIAPWSFKILIDNVLNGDPLESGPWISRLLSFLTSKEALGFFAIMMYFGSNTLAYIIDYFVGISTKKLNRRVIASFSQKAFDNLEKLSAGFYKKQQIGDYIYRLSYDVSALGGLLEEGILPIINNFLFLVVTIVLLFYINVHLAILALIILPFLAITLGVFNKRISETSQTSEQSNSTLFAFIEEILSQLRIVQAFNKQDKESSLFRQKEQSSLLSELNMHGFGFLMNLLIGIVIAVSYSIILLYGIRLVFSGQLSTGLLIAFILYLDNLSQPLLSFVTAIATTKENYIKVSRMNDFFEPRFKEQKTGALVLKQSPEISFRRVSIDTGKNRSIVKNLSFEIPAGKKTVVVGVNGSGKTTIANLILKFLHPTSGNILLDGQNLSNYDLLRLREDIAFVPQEIVLFNESIRNNIAFGKSATNLNEIKRAAQMARAHDFIDRLPGGYNFVVGEEGLNLSGGQRQRIMLARAFMRTKAKILILDEPLSALDIKSRAVILENLNLFGQGKTTIFISNVLEVVSQADYVVVLNQGRVLHSGSVQSLLHDKNLADLILEEA
jgi:ABC-type multidrug transport system fused ATPase/permease subunit